MIRLTCRFLALLVVFNVLVVDVDATTNFTISGNLLCPHRFDYYILLVEKDSVTGDDIFNDSQSPGHTPGKSSSFKSTGTLFSDVLFGNDEYEVAVQIVHNCCDPLKPYRNLEVFVGNFKNEDVHYKKDIGSVQIHNQGEPTTAPIGKRRRPSNQKKL
ncbi:hypothetical protein CAEBREN_23989 [Caenorhabditis brenneri]|uniref:Uncharacterized protein n=1 Tax=Caenorhabditis brenneri TaxID=135651 RepID=G0MB29_CAEBE|nr:hypothetical protein CAEBREN_23989 [Caenorhabditis brenneri]